MTDWCAADWNVLADRLSSVNWHVHSMGEKDLVDYLSAGLTIVTAILAVFIAYRQWRTSEKERLAKTKDVYMDCYYKIVEALYIFAHGAIGETEETEECLKKSGKLMIDAYGLAVLRLPAEVVDYVVLIRDAIFRAGALRAGAYGLKPYTEKDPKKEEELISIYQKTSEEKPWLFFREYVEKL